MSHTGYFHYHLRTVVHCAAGAIIRIPSLFDGLGAKRILLLSDQGLKQAGVVENIISVFQTQTNGAGPSLVGEYLDIAPDAACGTLNSALAYARQVSADAILAVGGGSVLDAAKGIKYAMHHNLTDVREAIQAGVKLESWPNAKHSAIAHIAVPTTAGTGAEVTSVAVLYNEQAGIKGNLVAPFIEADIAVLDANLTLGLPPGLTASTGMDALTHAVEAVASPNANTFSDAHAYMAAQKIMAFLPEVVNNGGNVDARSEMLQASTMACNAFVNALNAAPVHNCAHAMGALYHIPHGVANAVLLPIVVDVLREFYLPQVSRLAFALGVESRGLEGEPLLNAVVDRIKALQKILGCPQNFSSFCIPVDDLDKIKAAVSADPAALFYPIPEKLVEIIVNRAVG